MKKRPLRNAIGSFVIGMLLISIGAYKLVTHLDYANDFFKAGILLNIFGVIWLFLHLRMVRRSHQ